MRRFIPCALGFAAVLAACEETTSPPPVSPLPSASPVASDPAPVTPKDAGAGSGQSVVGSGAKLCGCSLCEPLPSSDACSKDEDCAPKTACHAKACVAKASAEPRPPGTMCTQDLQCDSIDANACGCVKGKCALYPRKT